MGMFGEAAGSILRLPMFLGVRTASNTTIRISSAQLDAVLNQAENATLKARALVAGRCQSDLTRSVESAAWSVAQCLDHLAQTTNAFVPAIASAIEQAPHLTTNRALRTGALLRLFIRNLEPPYRLRFKVLTALVPCQRDFDSAWSAFEASRTQLAKTIRSAAGLAIDQVKVESPVYARFSYNVYGALRMLTAHERRHLWQIDQILKALGKPDLSAA
ncbi:MAG TPA: DinB family protein [Terriglobales bacterium]|jgi:hypothetical protein|nr:DinB family protein [Terriglobales bacterium]